MGARTIRDFTTEFDPWPIIDGWANETGYRLKSGIGPSRLYQKGVGFLTAPMMLQIDQTGNRLHVEAWIRVNLFVRITALFLIPAEMGIESGGFKLVVPRSLARNRINTLLQRLNQVPIP